MKRVTALMCMAFYTAAAYAAPMNTANRTAGVAPLGVFFDAVGSPPLISPTLVPQPYGYADLNFEWSFGDDSSAVWATNGRSKDEATGFVAAHVYEDPGTYIVTLRVTMPDGAASTYEQTITVQDPAVVYANSSNATSERTYYVSALGNDNNNGSLNLPFRTVERGLTRLFAANGPKRLLLRRGDSFAGGDGIYVAGRTGPFTIGAYGTGPDPVITFSASTNGAALQLSASTTDVRIMDLDIIGPTVGHTITPGVNATVLRVDVTGAGSGISTSELNGNKSGVFVVDSTFIDSDNYGIYYNFGEHVAVLGNLIDSVAQEHLMRCYLTHSVIGHNIFRGGAPSKHQLKFVGYAPTGDPDRSPGLPTEEVEYSVIADNLFEQPGPLPWMITMGPTDSGKDQRTSNVVFERNVLHAGPSTSDMLYLNNSLITVRNNVFDASNSTATTAAVRVTQRGIEPPPTLNRVLHNTVYRGDPGDVIGVQVDSMAQNTIVRNNLVGAENSTAVLGAGTGLQAARNLSFCDAGFVDPARGNFELRAKSPAIDRGVALSSVPSDFLGVARPIDGNSSGRAERDVGAFEFSPLRRGARRDPASAGR